MFITNLVLSLHKTLAVKARTVVSSLKIIQRNASKSVTSLNVRSHVDKDVVLFSFEKPKFFVWVNIFSTVQCLFWTYLGLFVFQALNKSNIDLNSSKSFWSKILLEERKHSFALSFISLIFGWSIFGATCFYSFRNIRKIILHRGGREVTIITYNLPGYNTIKTPLSNMSSFEHRTKAKKFIPIKLKDQFFYYLIDIRGEFLNPALFDCTAGMKRAFKLK